MGLRMESWNLKKDIQKSVEVGKEKFKNSNEINLFMLESHMLDHVAKDKVDLGCLVTVVVLTASI